MLPLAILALLLPLQDTPSEKCSLSGTVVDSVTGAPLNKVELRLEPIERQATHVAVTTTDAKGRFAMVDLDPGRYRLRGGRGGYLEMAYGARRPNGEGTLLELEAGQAAQDMNFKLIPSAVIAGTVRDSDGEPLEGATVTLAEFTYGYGRPRAEGCDNTQTDDRGEYRFRGLAAGKYYVGVEPESHGWDRVDHSANGGPTETSVPTLYPGVTDVAMAAPIEVSAGRSVTGIDMTLLRSRVFRVSGRVLKAPAAGRPTVTLHDPQNAGMRDFDLRTPTLNAAGDFEFRGVPPGSYELTVATEALQGSASIVVGGSDVEGVRVPLTTWAEVKGRITVEGDIKPKLGGQGPFFTVDGRSGGTGEVAEDGAISAVALWPNHYDVAFLWRLPQGFYVKSIRSGENDVLSEGLTVAGGGTIDYEVVIASDGGGAQGVVLDKDQRPVAGATVLLAPDRRSRLDLFKSTASDQYGHYEFASIAPGDYKLFAWDDVEPEAWNDPDFLKDYEKQGEKAAVEPKSRAPVNLHLASGPDGR
jgi:protocatechuate 3,4-dioxygenase beta subunit